MESFSQSDGWSIPSTMRAWTYNRRGLPSQVVQLDPHFKAPSLLDVGPQDVLVEIECAAMNGGIPFIMQILPPLPFSITGNRAAIPEAGFSGTIRVTGRDVTSARPDLQCGATVFGICRPAKHYLSGDGTLAEYIIVPASQVVSFHSSKGSAGNLSMAEAAGISGNGVTAIQVVDLTRLTTGEKVLINGGSSGVGMVMIQVARSVVGEAGQVVATGSAAKHQLLKALGASAVIDYREHDPLHEYLQKSVHAKEPFDAVIDCIGVKDLYVHSPGYLATGKPYLNIGSLAATPTTLGFMNWIWTQISNRYWPIYLGGTPRPYRFCQATPDVKTLERVKRLVEQDKLRQVLDSIWEMEEVPKAYRLIESHKATGKVIIHVGQ